MINKMLFAVAIMLFNISLAQQIQKVNINVKSSIPSGIIDSKIYGQLFEHIYYSADGGLCGEMISERSFEPEQYNGVPKRDGYFDGWYGINHKTLISPTLFEDPIP